MKKPSSYKLAIYANIATWSFAVIELIFVIILKN